jgi:plasmid stabilization system protein ParE
MEIKYTAFAFQQLELIYEFIKTINSETVAKKEIQKILHQISHLENNPNLGKEEEILKKLNKNYRYIILSNYKIIYQNPKKITKRNK